MLRNLSVKAFKSLVELDIELGRINVFVGANGSGKSNILEAVGVLGAAANGRVDDESLLHRGVRPGVPALYKSSFKGLKRRPSIRFEASSDAASFGVELHNPIHDPSPAWKFKSEQLLEHGVALTGRSPASYETLDPERGLIALKAVEFEAAQPAYTLLKALREYSIYSPNTSTLRGLTPDAYTREPVGLSGGRLAEAVHELVDTLPERAGEVLELIDWVQDVDTKLANPNIPLSPSVARPRQLLVLSDRFMLKTSNTLTSYDASEGALYVFFAAALALLPKAPKTFAIDNIAQGLNPRLARALVQRMCAWILERAERQVLMTTHNPLVLDGLPLDNDEVRLFAVGRSRKGRTTVRRVQLALDDLQRDGELWTVSRLWIMGHLGGMPDV